MRKCFTTFILVLSAALGFSPASGRMPGSHPVWLPVVLNSQVNSNPIHQGIATYYDATGAGACSFEPSPQDLMVAAMNAEEYDNAAVCGAYLYVTGPKGAVTVRIVDLCPECQAGHLDLSREAFAQIAELPQGRVPITWQLVSPALNGPIAYHFKDGSNQWWTAVQIRNHRNPIARLEYLNGDQWVTVPRTAWATCSASCTFPVNTVSRAGYVFTLAGSRARIVTACPAAKACSTMS
jgi:expansin (peptidoglycan-binding protein)